MVSKNESIRQRILANKEKIIKLSNENKTLSQMSEIMNLAVSTLSRYLQEWGVRQIKKRKEATFLYRLEKEEERKENNIIDNFIGVETRTRMRRNSIINKKFIKNYKKHFKGDNNEKKYVADKGEAL